ncbi:MAG: DNA-directed DNA polymerase II small subunit [Candidatus Micrarchaeaceae archaeon]
MEDKTVVIELASRLAGVAVLSNELVDSDINSYDIEELNSKIIAYFQGSQGLKILDKKIISEIMDVGDKKKPEVVEVIQPLDFKPIAKEYDAQYKINITKVEKTGNTIGDFSNFFNDRYKKLKDILNTRINLGRIITSNKISEYIDGKEITVVGIVNEKFITKNGNILINVDDEEGSLRILVMKPNKFSKKESIELFEGAKKIINDEVIAVKGSISRVFIIAKSIIFPDVTIRNRKKTEEDLAIAFTSDTHVGSKLFLEKEFLRFIEWLNGNVNYRRDLAGKIKYLVFGGDIVDGIGVYPEQDKELSISDIYKQYAAFFRYAEMIPDYIKVFIIPGNHDAVQRADPQPKLSDNLIQDFKKENVNFLTSPSYLNINGLNVLTYHGNSLDSVIHNIVGCNYFKPEMAMVEILKRRHLSPIYGENPINPGRTDPLVIQEEPDILHMGHVHKNGNIEYHGTQIINSGTWQARTNYQLKLGHIPSPSLLPIYEMKKGTIQELNFGGL